MKKHILTTAFQISAAAMMCCLCILIFFCPVFADGGDDFNDGVRQACKWRRPSNGPTAVLHETGGHLQFTSAGTSDGADSASWEWRATHVPAGSDWDIRLDVHNHLTLTSPGQATGLSLEIRTPLNDNWLLAELLTEYVEGIERRTFIANTNYKASAVSPDMSTVDGALRTVYDSNGKNITVYFDNDTADGYQWKQVGSFGIAGSGGDSGTVNWDLADDAKLSVSVNGFSLNAAVAAGEMYADNFMETGGSGPCPAAAAMGEKHPALDRLRAFRDNQLAATPAGRWLITLYYDQAEHITRALECSPALRALCRKFLAQATPLITGQ